MEGALKGLYGGGEVSDEHKAAAKDFANRVTTGDPTKGFSDEEAVAHFQAAVQHSSPEQLQKATAAAVNNLSPDQRSQFNEMLKQRQAGQGMVPIQQAGGGSASPADAGGGGGGIDDILGGLLGGAGGGGLGGLLGGLLGGGGSGGSGSGGGLGGMLGGLLGGDKGDQEQAQPGFQQSGAPASAQPGIQQAAPAAGGGGGGMMDSLGDIMKSPIGKAVIAGIGAFAVKEIIDKGHKK